MRLIACLAAAVFAYPAMGYANPPEPLPDSSSLTAMEHRAEQADPRERSFLYTQLAHVYTEIASQQIALGELEAASVTLKHVEHYGELVHAQLSRDSKRLKNSEMLMHETTHRLAELTRIASYEDKAEVQTALKQLNHVNEEILAQVFAH